MLPAEMDDLVKRSVLKHVNCDETLVFLFGSRAWGQGLRGSDYDIGLYMGEPVPHGVIGNIEEEIEKRPIPVDVDLIDFSKTSEDFRKLALRKIKIWNKPKKNLSLI